MFARSRRSPTSPLCPTFVPAGDRDKPLRQLFALYFDVDVNVNKGLFLSFMEDDRVLAPGAITYPLARCGPMLRLAMD